MKHLNAYIDVGKLNLRLNVSLKTSKAGSMLSIKLSKLEEQSFLV
jgi:hypothetical protein